MAQCDVCSMPADFNNSYALTTIEVVGNKNYWSYMIDAHSFDEELLMMYVQQQAMQRTGWLICNNCSRKFTFNQESAKRYASTQTDPPGSGPADLNQVAAAAALAWKEKGGTLPSWVR